MNQRVKNHLIALLCGAIGVLAIDFIFTSWKESRVKTEDLVTKEVATPYITVTLPNQRWHKEEIRSTESSYALLTGEGIDISVYAGSKADPLEYPESDYIIVNKKVNEHDVKIAISRDWDGVVGMTYMKGTTRVTLLAKDLLRYQKEKALMIFETVH